MATNLSKHLFMGYKLLKRGVVAGRGGGVEVGGGAVMQVWVELEFFLRLLL